MQWFYRSSIRNSLSTGIESYRPELNDGVARTTGGRQEPHHAHQSEKYYEVMPAVDRTYSLGGRAQASDTGAVAVGLHGA